MDLIELSFSYSDHCGALPYFTEMMGYDGPIYMTHPTKAICPILLEDFRKIQVERKGDSHFFTSQNIKDCMKKVTPVALHQCIQVGTFALGFGLILKHVNGHNLREHKF